MLIDLVKKTKTASLKLASLNTEVKNNALKLIAKKIENNKSKIFEANEKDLQAAKKMLDKNEINLATYNRLKLDENKLRDMVAGIKDVIKLDDPINKRLSAIELNNNLVLEKISTPIGVLAVIFEARPDIISQISSLAIKTGNAIILKGGSEAINTNETIYNLINEALEEMDEFPNHTISLITSRDEVKELLKMDHYIDLVIPRGGNSLVTFVKENTRIPVLGHADGVCHIYIDETADLTKAQRICVEAKVQYPSACNAVETILINDNFKFKNEILKSLKDNGVQIVEAPDSWHIEYGDKIVSVKTVKNLDEAIKHINENGSHHTDCIISENKGNAETFMHLVDSAGVFHNASTRFADGFRYGLGAEVGISTNKTHARGPVGLEGLTIYKYKLFGSGNTVEEYCLGKKQFTHKKLY